MLGLDRERARSLMAKAGIDALVLFQPENFQYATGQPGGVATMWRRAGGAVTIVPFDPSDAIVAIVPDLFVSSIRSRAPDIDVRDHPIWVDCVDLSSVVGDLPTADRVTMAYREQGLVHPRPETFDIKRVLGLIRAALNEKGLGSAKIGTDFSFLPVADFELIKADLHHVTWVDGSDVIRRLRAIKSPSEIALLRSASALAEAGLRHMMIKVQEGGSVRMLSDDWRAGVGKAAEETGTNGFTGSWDFIAIGSDPWSSAGIVEKGAIIKADVGCLVNGYSSDGARTFSFGKPSLIAKDIFGALSTAFERGLEAIRPGVTLGDVHAAILREMRSAGYTEYHRGHFGHGLGASVGSEEWPFISANNEEVIQPGMVLALETPFYAKGVGALMIEDQLVVTEDVVEVLNVLPREMIDLA